MCTLKMSDTRDKIFSAIAKMQAELTNATKNKQGHGYNYSDLAECIETAKEPLSKNGLAVSQMLGMKENETTLITMLLHESGEYIGSEFIMEKAVLGGGAGKNPAQAMGASITYMRRYAFAAIIGLSQVDDDNASNTQTKNQPQSNAKPTQQPAPKQQSLQERKNRLFDTLNKECGSPLETLAYISKALNRSISSGDEVTVQDLTIINQYYTANKPVKKQDEVGDLPWE